MKVAIEQIFNGSIPQVAIGGAYDPTKINRGKHTGQFNIGSNGIDKFIGPAPIDVANLAESSLAIPSQFVHPVKITDDLFWIFGSDAATAAATRRVQLWTWVPSTNTYTFIGAITCTFPTATAHTVRGIRVILENYTTGTVGVSGTAVTGTGTAWNTGLSVGSRIGFGSTDPNAITTWFQISAIGSDTSITLTGSAGTISAGTPYVIQDLMIVQATTNATVTNGGLFVTKGLQFADFQNPATAIPAATTVDKIKATYWLRDAATITNTIIGGCALGDRDSWTQQYVYSTNGSATSLVMYRYNIRTPLTLTAGAATLTGSDIVITGTQAVTGNISQGNNGRVATLQHGAGAGVASLYLFTTTRILRVPLANITNGNTTFVADTMSEVPPGGTNTNATTGTFTSLDVASSLDKLVITSATSTGTVYVTDYYTSGEQIDRRSGCLTTQLPSALRVIDSSIFVHNPTTGVPFIWVEDGWLFWLYAQIATTNINALTVYPLAADLEFQADVNNRVILPKISLGSVPYAFYRVLINPVKNIGDNIYGVAPDMYVVQYRTSGIDDDTGIWREISQDGNLSTVPAAANIQFAFRFRTVGVMMLPARILSIAFLYETDDGIPSQYRWDNDDFNLTNNTFAFKQVERFYSTPPVHNIEIYREDTDALVLSQSSSGNTNGNFQYWNGTTWVNGIDGDTLGLRRRFVPTASLPSTSLYSKVKFTYPQIITDGLIFRADSSNYTSFPVTPPSNYLAPGWSNTMFDLVNTNNLLMNGGGSVVGGYYMYASNEGYIFINGKVNNFPDRTVTPYLRQAELSSMNPSVVSNQFSLTNGSSFTLSMWIRFKTYTPLPFWGANACSNFLSSQASDDGSINSANPAYFLSVAPTTVASVAFNPLGIIGPQFTCFYLGVTNNANVSLGFGIGNSSLNQWVYLTVTFNNINSGTIRTFTNGVQFGSITLPSFINVNTRLGFNNSFDLWRNGNGPAGIDFDLGDVHYYNRILTNSEILYNYINTKPRFEI